MSLYGALFSGVSGLQAQSSAMGAIADNVTNVNTIGYKGTKVNFQTLITKQVSLTQYSAGGVQAKPRQGVDIQGLLQSTSSATDIGISGNGFFIVNEAAEPGNGDRYGYTRAGSFKVDKDGFLQNVGGSYMQGWPLMNSTGAAGAVEVTIGGEAYMKAYTKTDGLVKLINDGVTDSDNLRPLNLNTIGGTANNTTSMSLGANLPKDKTIGGSETANMLIYDTLGGSHNLNMIYTKRATNTWDLDITPPLGSYALDVEDQSGTSATYSSAGRLDFTALPQVGESMTVSMYDTVAGASQTITINFQAGATDTSTTLLAGADLAAEVQITAGSTLSQVVDDIATALEGAMAQAAQTTANSAPTTTGKWAERVSGETSIVMRQFASSGTMTVDASSLTDGSADPVVMQTQANFVIPALSATVGWVAEGTSTTTTTARRFVNFNGNGTPNTFFGKDASSTGGANPRPKIEITWANGSSDMSDAGTPTIAKITLFQGNYDVSDGLTQFEGDYQTNYISQNGAKFGNYAGVSIGADGVVTALFDNGVTIPVFMIPVATFVNPNAMESISGNMWIETDFSGQPTVREPGDGGAGSTNSAALEASTVDLGAEFTDMITTQRAYSASAKIISTSDEMLEELIRIKR
ncbi:MAG: flagellar hook-basal body complex protein [Rhodospirillales bacterium]|nr:flagellar hook-basal body complex protein [Rhodospirillales bacterium]